MPKRKSKNKIDEKILKELAEKLKEEKDIEGDDSEENNTSAAGLENDARLNLRDFEFHNFMQGLDNVSAPVLERIAGSQAGPVFVGGISRAPQTIPGEEKNADPFKYVPGNNAAGEPKYIDSDSHIRANMEKVNFDRIGRNFEPWKDINQETMFMQSPEARVESFAQERVWGAERFDAERERRKNPVEREEAKYDKYKPDLPKSR